LYRNLTTDIVVLRICDFTFSRSHCNDSWASSFNYALDGASSQRHYNGTLLHADKKCRNLIQIFISVINQYRVKDVLVLSPRLSTRCCQSADYVISSSKFNRYKCTLHSNNKALQFKTTCNDNSVSTTNILSEKPQR